jgi:hypothetical protein
MKNILTVVFVLAMGMISNAQDLNSYKYIIVPETYEFTAEMNQYQLNSLTKFLLEQEGFNTVMREEKKPADLEANSCLALKANVKDNSGLFVTKLVLQLTDCYGKLVFESKEGRSREKEYQAAYHEALRDAFSSLAEVEYSYNPSNVTETPQPPKQQAEDVQPKRSPEIDDEPISVKIEEKPEASTVKNEKQKIVGSAKYEYSGKTYELKQTAQGLGLYQENSLEPIAILIESEAGKNYIYNSLTTQGIASFDADKNLIIEYFDRRENKKVTLRYILID